MTAAVPAARSVSHALRTMVTPRDRSARAEACARGIVACGAERRDPTSHRYAAMSAKRRVAAIRPSTPPSATSATPSASSPHGCDCTSQLPAQSARHAESPPSPRGRRGAGTWRPRSRSARRPRSRAAAMASAPGTRSDATGGARRIAAGRRRPRTLGVEVGVGGGDLGIIEQPRRIAAARARRIAQRHIVREAAQRRGERGRRRAARPAGHSRRRRPTPSVRPRRRRSPRGRRRDTAARSDRAAPGAWSACTAISHASSSAIDVVDVAEEGDAIRDAAARRRDRSSAMYPRARTAPRRRTRAARRRLGEGRGERLEEQQPGPSTGRSGRACRPDSGPGQRGAERAEGADRTRSGSRR